MAKVSIQIAATFTAEPVKNAIEFLFGLLGIPVELGFAQFNQVFQELLAPSGAFARNSDGVNVVLLRFEDLAEGGKQPEKLTRNADELITALQSAVARSQVPMLLVICPPSSAALADAQIRALLLQIETKLEAALRQVKGLHLIGSVQISQLCSAVEYDNPRGNRLGAVPYTPRFYALLGGLLARTVHRLTSPPHKVIVLDCDQTLWKGVCGEDGPQGIELDAPRRFLQEFMVGQSQAGMLLCLCSKNNEADVWEVFAQRSDMPLKRKHIVSARINWEVKSQNIRSLARELQLGLDSFIFVDDDAVVCAEVEANCPEVLTIRLPEDITRIPEFFCHYWAFDHLQVTAEDRQRTEMYRHNAERNRLLEKSSSLEAFLQSLDLKCEITPLSPDQLPRAAQLTQRTNQFNASGIRRNETELQQLLDGRGAGCLVVEVCDRFGDYGLVGVMIYFIREQRLEVDSFLLSCRALGRGVEHRMLSALGKLAAEAGLGQVALRFTPTKKNQAASDFLEKTGSAFKESNDAGAIFRYPTSVAREMTYVPDSSSSVESPTVLDSQPLPGSQLPSAGSELQSAPQPSLVAPKSDAGGTLNPNSQLPTPNSHLPTSISQLPVAAGLYQIALELHRPELLLARLAPVETTRPRLEVSYVPAGNEVEAQLVRLWEQLLKVNPIGVDDDYFALGGDSLMAVCLFVEIEEKFGRPLSLATLFTAPTVRKLAQCLNGSAHESAWRYLVPIQTGGSRPPLFCMHAAGGNVLFYRDLSRHLGPDQPVYGLQAREMPGTGAYLDRVEDMAAEYLKEITRLQPEGPYYVCGSSFGGLLAYETAQQLKARGQEVALLALFDTYGPGYPQRLSNSKGVRVTVSNTALRLKNLKGQFARMNAKERVQFVRAKAGKAVVKFRRKWLWKKNEFQIKYSQALGRELPKDIQRNHKAIQHALDSYAPKPYPGRMTLYRAAIQPKRIVPDHLLGWRGLPTGGIDVFESPGAHGAMTVDPYAEPLAKQLLPVLANCRNQKRKENPEAHAKVPTIDYPNSLEAELLEH